MISLFTFNFVFTPLKCGKITVFNFTDRDGLQLLLHTRDDNHPHS